MTASSRFSPARRLRTLLGLLILLGMIARSALAQFSPGPLSSAHSDLEGATKCLNCHGLKNNGGDMSGQCLSCHKGIARLAAEHRGLHGRDGRKPCTTCHVEHKGRDSSLIDRAKLAPGGMDHAEVGWPLSGKHLTQKCEGCHKRENQDSELLALEPRPDAPHGFIGLSKECASCHKDPHEGRLGTNCAECHRETGFHDGVRETFAHERTQFPLRGAHARVDCAKCHDPVAAWGKRPTFGSCSACHTDAHAGQALLSGQRVDCNACHNEDGFSVTSFDRVRHGGAPFPLEGKHLAVACEKCHPKRPKDVAPASLGEAGILIRRPHGRCDDCHTDAHAGQFKDRADRGDCRACHKVEGWKPATWGANEHQALAFPLAGRHAKVACKGCHGPDRPGSSSAAATGVAGTAGMLFKLGRVTCLSCHIDPHDGKYVAADSLDGKRTCTGCHDIEHFRPSRVDIREHGRFDYPLDGAHRAVACVDCHRGLDRPPLASSLISGEARAGQVSFERKHQDCSDCHADFHEGQLRGPCSRCHDTNAFRPASGFAHDRDAAFPLSGAHTKVACDRCHPVAIDAAGKRRVTFRPISVACTGCHVGTPGISGPTNSDPRRPPPNPEPSGVGTPP